MICRRVEPPQDGSGSTHSEADQSTESVLRSGPLVSPDLQNPEDRDDVTEWPVTSTAPHTAGVSLCPLSVKESCRAGASEILGVLLAERSE